MKNASPSHIVSMSSLLLALLASSAHANINIGIVTPLTGGSAPMGQASFAGAKVAVAEINSKGGVTVDGKKEKLVLIERDDQAKNENGPLFAQELIKDKHIVAGIGGCNTGVQLPAISVYQDAKIPFIVPCATGVPITKPENTYVFRTSANDLIQTTKLVADAKARGAKKVALFTDTTAYGKLIHDELIARAKEQGVEIVSEQSFAVGDKDMTSQLLKAKEAKADFIITGCIAPEAAVIVKNMAKLKYKVPVSGSWTLSMTNFIDATKEKGLGDGVRMPATFLQFSAKGPKQTEFVKAAAKEYGDPILGSGPSSAQTYDAVYLLKAAIEQANSTDGTKIKEALENLEKPVEGVIRTYNKPFSKTNHNAQTAESTGMGEIKGGKALMITK